MRIKALTFLILSAPIFIACQAEHEGADHNGKGDGDKGHSAGAFAKAVIEAKSGSKVSGSAHFQETKGGVLVTIDIKGSPAGWHAVHVHEKGDCSAADGTSAGGHFNPGTMDHGSPHAPMHHAGDLGNMFVGEDGVGHHAIFMPELSVAAGDFSVVGRGIIVHAGVDDLVSQPTGAAGGRIGCGVIQAGR